MYYVGYCQSYANFSWALSRLVLYSNFLRADTCSSKLLCCSCLLNDVCIPDQNNMDECIELWFPSNYASRSTIGSHIFLFRQFELISIFFCLDCAVPGWWAPLHAFPFHLIIVLDLNEMFIWELMAAICIAIDPNSKRHAMHTACRDMIYFFFHPSVPHSSSCFCFKYLLSVAISGCGTTCCYCMIMTACLTKQIFNFNPFLAKTEFVNGNVVLSHPIK